jgi:hypothetical protein
MWQRWMATFLRGKCQILWDVTVNIAYVHHVNFLALRSRDMFDANNKAVDYLYCALCQSEFDRVQTEDLACRIWEQQKNAHAGDTQVQALKDRLGNQRGGSEWEPIKILYRRSNSAYAQIHNQGLPHEFAKVV